jgi:hypothetical protein
MPFSDYKSRRRDAHQRKKKKAKNGRKGKTVEKTGEKQGE